MRRTCLIRRCRPVAVGLVTAAAFLGAATSQLAVPPAAGMVASIHLIEGNPKNHNQVLL